MGTKKNRKKKSASLKAEIEEEMKRSGYDRTSRNARFVSIGFIKNLFKSTNPPKLQRSIQADLETLKREGLELQDQDVVVKKLVAHVTDDASKLYAVLLLVDQSQRIFQLYNNDHPITDRIFEKGENSCDVPYCSLQYLKAMPQMSDIANEIFEKQWCIPPILRREVHQKYPVERFRFPFQGAPEEIGRGGGGGVFKVKVAEGHLEAGDQNYVRGSVVAYKEVSKRTGMTEERLMREVNSIRSRKHPNIVPFFAGFSAGRENPWNITHKIECLHMLFEHTDAGNMHDWLALECAPEPLADMTERRRYITNCIESLISAVTFIHSEIDDFIAYHHDLKPKNILLFKGPPDVWKICDFGMANLKHHEDESGTTHGPDNRFGTYDYQPPEYFTDDSNSKHGRPFDVYSIGCVILELTTVLIHGWSKAGIPEFRRLRGENTEHACTNRPEKPKPDHSFHNSPNVVEDWIRHLREGTDIDEKLKILLDLITEMLVARARRIFIWEVDMDLYEMGGSRTQEHLKHHLRKVVQPSDTSLNDLNNEHNPLKRAVQKNKAWQKRILKQNKWSTRKPEPSNQLRIKRRETGIYHSTLKACQYTRDFECNTLFGRHDMDVKIAEGLKISNCVGLYGMSGMGKSHLAYHYIVRFRDTDSTEDRKHTFWVEADTEARFQQTVRKIGEEIQLEVSEPENLFVSVNQWLSDSMNGPWIMVVDGLDNSAVAAALKRLLPRDSGQILITSKNRAILDSLDDFLPPRKRKQVCLQIENLAVSESRRVFQWHNDDVLPNNSEMEDLLSKFSSPVLIKLVAKYFLNNNIPTSELYKSIKDGKSLKFQERVYKDLSKKYLIFEPLITSMPQHSAPPTRFRSWPSAELRLLGELSCLNKDEIAIRLIQQNYRNETRLLEMMGLLENCSYIGKGRIDSARCYFMHETVQELVRQWVLSEMGLAALLNLHETALCMLITLYKDDKSNEADAKKIRRSSYFWKLRFMAHFDRFLDFAREFSTKLDQLDDLECSDRMVHSVITFSHVYLDEGRYEDAACVLEFTRELYKGTKYKPHLVRHLSKAYILPPLSGLHEEERSKAATMLAEVIFKCVGPSDNEQRWLCVLDLADIHCKSLRPEDASAALQSLREVSVGTNRGAPKLRRRGKKIFKETVESKLAIMKQIAEAKVYTARADCATTPAVKNKECSNAHTAYSHAKSAISSWLPGERIWVLEVDVQMAKVLCKMDNPDSTKKAIETFKKLFKRLQAEFHAPNRVWSQKRLWDIECQIACAQLQLGARWEGVAVQTLERVLGLYEMCYGKRDGQHDEHTRACAHHLHEAYLKVGNASKAQETKERYSLLPMTYTRMPEVIAESRWFRKWFCTIILLFVISILVLFYNFRYSLTETGEL